MRPLSTLLGLPSALLLLLAAQVTEAQADDAQQLPTAVRMMGTDAGEKFLHEYSAFGGDLEDGSALLHAANASAPATPYRAPLAAHLYDGGGGAGWDVLRRLATRDFACPTGSSDCSAIGHPNSCCQAGTACVGIADTGLGPVGCCPDGQSCSGTIACSGGQEGCSSESGGGCCIPGYACASVGCTKIGAATTTVTLSRSTASSAQPTTTTTTTATTATTTHSSSASATASATTTGDASAPVRPTSDDGGATTPRPSGYCPTGFYACSAVYGGGCCQTGRDCQVTSCPATASTTVVSAGATVVVPATDAPPVGATGSCAGGWTLCPAATGVATAGCCPGGYSCGTASCFLATAGATASVAKELPGSGAARGPGPGVLAMPGVVAFALGVAWA